ncbi:MAG: DUF2442 domain-containing protein [Bacteroidales bacterium]|nr:DUF2442 domain-containing protein [Bacteroidales bacterium]
MRIIKTEYLGGFRLRLFFNNGEIFEPLKDIEFFKKFTVKFNTVEWENGADFAPEYLYEISEVA